MADYISADKAINHAGAVVNTRLPEVIGELHAAFFCTRSLHEKSMIVLRAQKALRMMLASVDAAVAEIDAALSSPKGVQHAGDVACRVVEPITKRYPDGEPKYSVRPARDAAERGR